MSPRVGKVITFYSYKGGTGRSMALANVAWILAANGHRVLAIDWDLEAPGLHRYFRPFLVDPELSDSEGLINFFWTYAANAMTPKETNEDDREQWQAATDLGPYTVQLDWDFPDDGCLDFICAGRQDAEYAEMVNSFDWANLYRRLRGKTLFTELRERLTQDYDFILIDSRTGVSDTASICTVAMPDSVVALFTLGRQSVTGVAAVLDSIVAQRTEREFTVFPIVTRVELAEKERLEAARSRMRTTFQKFIDRTKARSVSGSYWEDAEILYQPYYAYEEVLAPFGDPTGGNRSANSLLAAMERLTAKVTGHAGISMPVVPEEKRRQILGQFSGTESKEKSIDPSSAEERRTRAERYLVKDLQDAKTRFARQAAIARFWSRMTATLVFGSVLFYLGNLIFDPYLFVLGGVIGMTIGALVMVVFFKAWEMVTARSRAEFDYSVPRLPGVGRYFPGLVTLVFLLFAFVLQFTAPEPKPLGPSGVHKQPAIEKQVAIVPETNIAGAIICLVGVVAQSLSLLLRFDETARRLAKGVDALESELRMYSNQFGAYETESDPTKAWRKFISEAEGITAFAEKGPSAVAPPVPPAGAESIPLAARPRTVSAGELLKAAPLPNARISPTKKTAALEEPAEGA